MAIVKDTLLLTPFETLAEYERSSLAHVAGLPEQIDAPGLWRGIGFRIGQHYLVSSIAEVNEILTPPIFAIVPGTSAWFLGVANVRGNLVPVVDLKGFIENDPTSLTDTSRVLLVRQSGGSVGLLVDEVLGQRNFSEQQRMEAVGEEDERYAPYVGEKIQMGGILWGLFSMVVMVRTPEFQKAAM